VLVPEASFSDNFVMIFLLPESPVLSTAKFSCSCFGCYIPLFPDLGLICQALRLHSGLALAVPGFVRPVLAPHMNSYSKLGNLNFPPTLNTTIAFAGHLWESNQEIHPQA